MLKYLKKNELKALFVAIQPINDFELSPALAGGLISVFFKALDQLIIME